MTRQFLDLTGEKFNYLTVLSFTGFTKHRHTLWLCVCDCGKIKIVTGNNLRSGCTQSCGCMRKIQDRVLVAKRAIYCQYLTNAKRRDIDFAIDFYDFCALISEPCYYCGRMDSNEYTIKHTGDKFRYNGVDRLDSTLGYTKENVAPCCKICNKAKLQASREEFLFWIEKVYNYSCVEKLV